MSDSLFYRPETEVDSHSPFSRESSQTRDSTQVSHIAGRFFTNCGGGGTKLSRASQVVLVVKNLLANAEDTGSIPGSGSSPGEGNGNSLQCSCLENPMDRGARLGYSPWGHNKSDMT